MFQKIFFVGLLTLKSQINLTPPQQQTKMCSKIKIASFNFLISVYILKVMTCCNSWSFLIGFIYLEIKSQIVLYWDWDGRKSSLRQQSNFKLIKCTTINYIKSRVHPQKVNWVFSKWIFKVLFSTLLITLNLQN